jgi:pyridoxine 5'-phosphate synthase PdxJ
MNAKSFVKLFVLSVVSVGVISDFAWADKQQVQEKLSKDISIKLNDVTISEALQKIGQKAELKVVLSDEAIWKLPYGEATRLSVMLSGPLADSMTEMLNAFFMRYAVGEDEITIYPRPELEHILGRPTTKQLELLKLIYTKTIKVYYYDEVQRTINEAIGQEVLISPIEMQTQLNNFLLQLAGKDDMFNKVIQGIEGGGRVVNLLRKRKLEPNEPTIYQLPTPVTLVQLLNQVVIGRSLGESKWYISGMGFPGQTPEVHVVHNTEFISLRLSQKIDVSYKDETLGKIFQDLASRSGMDLIVAPGYNLYEHKLSASIQNVEIRQAILSIALMSGIECGITEDGRIKLKGESQDGDKAASEGYVGKISIPMDGGKYYIEFMLRESDLTEKLKKLRADKMKEILDQLGGSGTDN